MADATVPAGWYPDSQLPNTLRWWDGMAWTTHTTPVEPTATPTSATPGTIVPAQSSAAPTPTPAQGPAVEPRHRGGLFGRKKTAVVEEPLKTVVVRVELDDGSFPHQVAVTGPTQTSVVACGNQRPRRLVWPELVSTICAGPPLPNSSWRTWT
jgi:hypothetical protein